MNKGSIVERLCSDLDRKEPRYKSPTLLLLYFTDRCTQTPIDIHELKELPVHWCQLRYSVRRYTVYG